MIGNPLRKKPELLRRMDSAVVLQREAAHRIARSLGGSFFPSPEKGLYLGILAVSSVDGKPAEPVRMEVRVRNFPSTEHDSTLIEKRVADRLRGKRVLYCEAFTDGVAVAYDLDSVLPLLLWHEADVNSTTVLRGSKVQKSVASIPYALGARVEMRPPTNTSIAGEQTDVTKAEPRAGQLF